MDFKWLSVTKEANGDVCAAEAHEARSARGRRLTVEVHAINLVEDVPLAHLPAEMSRAQRHNSGHKQRASLICLEDQPYSADLVGVKRRPEGARRQARHLPDAPATAFSDPPRMPSGFNQHASPVRICRVGG